MPKLHVMPTPIVIKDRAAARRLLKQILRQPWVSLDTETTSLSVLQAQVLCWTVSWLGPTSVRAYIPFEGQTSITLDIFKSWLEDPKKKKSYSNAKYDIGVFSNHGITVRGLLYDTQIIDWLLDENRRRHGLKTCALDHLGLKMLPYKEVLKRHKAETFSDVPEKEQIEYATEDAWATAALMSQPSRLWGKPLVDALDEHPAPTPGHANRTLLDHYHEVEIPFIQVLGHMERRGMAVDRGYLLDLAPDLQGKLHTLEYEFNRKTKRPVNIASTQDLGNYLFLEESGLNLKVTKWTKGGESGKRKPSVDKDVLETFARKEEREGKKGLFTLLGEHRKVSKILSTYVNGLLEASDSPDRRIHSSFRMDLVTGRLSSSNPNLQNIPRSNKDEYGLRQAFIATPSEVAGRNRRTILCLDYSQLEIRIAAHYSEDRKLIEAICSGADIHVRTAAEMYGLDYDEIMAAKKSKNRTAEQEKLVRFRDDAKTIGFGIIYGMQAFLLSLELGCSVEQAQDKINRYFAAYPGLAEWLERTKAYCRTNGHVQTLLGRYRRLRDIRKGLVRRGGRWVSNGDRATSKTRRRAENQAVNSPVQGGAADIVKMPMIYTSELEGYGDSELQKMKCHLILQVHDELLWDCPEVKVDRARQIITKYMEKPFDFDLRVPLLVEGGTAMAWSEAKG